MRRDDVAGENITYPFDELALELPYGRLNALSERDHKVLWN